MLRNNRYYWILFVAILVTSCAAPRELAVEVPVESEPVAETEHTEIPFDMEQYRVRPELVFHSIENTIPDAFHIDLSASAANANTGFRIQIISTQDVRLVEELRIEYNKWMSEEVEEYDAESYILFRQPFYRLHVGNFRSRTDAIEFAQVVKRKFPDAWIVFDTIDPNAITRRLVP